MEYRWHRVSITRQAPWCMYSQLSTIQYILKLLQHGNIGMAWHAVYAEAYQISNSLLKIFPGFFNVTEWKILCYMWATLWLLIRVWQTREKLLLIVAPTFYLHWPKDSIRTLIRPKTILDQEIHYENNLSQF